jgi:hypothetical protein
VGWASESTGIVIAAGTFLDGEATELADGMMFSQIVPAAYALDGSWRLQVWPKDCALTLGIYKAGLTDTVAEGTAMVSGSSRPQRAANTSANVSTGAITGWSSSALARNDRLTVKIESTAPGAGGEALRWFSLILEAKR